MTKQSFESDRTTKWITAFIAGALVLSMGVAALVIFDKTMSHAIKTSPQGEPTQVDNPEVPPALLPLETFIVNLKAKGSFLKVNIQLEFVSEEIPEYIEHDKPKIRHSIIQVLSSKSAEEILNPEGKQSLCMELKQAINQTLNSEDIAQVYFTEFIIQ